MKQGYRPPDVMSGQMKRESLLYAGIWLIFLVWTVVATTTANASLGAKISGWMAVLAFIVVYLYGMTHPRLFFTLPRWMTTLFYTVMLLLMQVIAGWTAGTAAFNMTIYVLALWLFSHRWRTGLLGACAVLAAVLVLTSFLIPWSTMIYVFIPLGSALAIVLLLRFLVERDEVDRAMAQQLALSQQRDELARTVHDVLGHSLTAISVSAQLARRLVERDPQAAAAQLDSILVTARTALSEVRSTVVELRQPDLIEQLQIAKALLGAAGVEVRLPRRNTVEGLDERHKDLFAWCLREGITNVVRHSRATQCSILITENRLCIDDDGVGPHGSPNSAGHGLAGLRQRVREEGGRLDVAELPEAVRGEVSRGGTSLTEEARPGTRLEVVL